MSAADRRSLERLRYQPGQLLSSRDFRDQAAIGAQLRWWHNRALHAAFGVAEGFGVTLGDAGGSIVTVTSGVAYDTFGRELVLEQPQTVSVPIAAALLTLRASYEASGPTVRLGWMSEHLAPSGGVPLARVIVDETGATSLDTTFIVPRAHALARPRMACGATIPGQTAWQRAVDPPVNVSQAFHTRPIVLEVEVDTASAGFTRVPRYFAWLQLPPLASTVSASTALPLLHVYARASDRFVVRVWVPHVDPPPLEAVVQRIRQGFVCWVGVEPDSTDDTDAQEVIS